MKKPLKPLVALVASYLLLEMACTIYFAIKLNGFHTPRGVAYETLGKFWSYSGPRKCPDQDPWAPHPYLGYARAVPTSADDCLGKNLLSNSKGMVGPDYPEQREPNVFVIMLTGGSFAERFGLARFDNEFYFQQQLNEKFLPPKGIKFKVIIGAHGDYRTPQNVIAPLIHHDIIDAVVDISGFNELMNYRKLVRPESPSILYWDLFRSPDTPGLKNEVRALIVSSETGLCQYSYSCVVVSHWRIQSKMKELQTLRVFNQQQRIYQYPTELSPEQRWQHSLNKHQGYYRSLQALCTTFNWRCVYFLQPIPQLEKTLTETEKSIVPQDTQLAEDYQRLVQGLLMLKPSGLSIHSLVSLYANERTTTYMDYVHISEGTTSPSTAQRLLAERLMQTLEHGWKLKKR